MAVFAMAQLPQETKFAMYDQIAEIEHGYAFILSVDHLGNRFREAANILKNITEVMNSKDATAEEKCEAIAKILAE